MTTGIDLAAISIAASAFDGALAGTTTQICGLQGIQTTGFNNNYPRD